MTKRKRTAKKQGGNQAKRARVESSRMDKEKEAMDRQTKCVELGKPDVLPLSVKANNVFTFVQTIPLTAITSSAVAGTEVDLAYQIQASLLDGVTAITSFFDQYRILQYTISFEPRYNMSNTAGTVLGTLTSAIDYDDASNQAATILRQKETCMVTPAYCPHVRTLKPHIAVAAYSGAFTSFTNVKDQWIDAASQNVQHYGVKMALTNCALVSTIIYDVTARIVLQGRQVQ
jgi:hypothetical protein